MPNMNPAGPFEMPVTADGKPFPYYIIPFDKDGVCEGPKTQEHLLAEAKGDFTDIFLFSHGWNNDWTTATQRYRDFLMGVSGLRKELKLPMAADYKPLLVGVFWPSQTMLWFDSETGPRFAAGSDPVQAAEIDASVLKDIASRIPPEKRQRFFELAQTPLLKEKEATEFADLLAGSSEGDSDSQPEGEEGVKRSGEDILAAAQALASADREPDYDGVGGAPGGSVDSPQAAGGNLFKALDPRNLVKPFTVWQMKDRAGRVGAVGVAPLLKGLLEASQARVHLIGHSYGCKVVMTAACRLPEGIRKVRSALLLQPAVSQFAFAPDVPKVGKPGGLFNALQRVELPILATFSRHDVPLTKLYHLALRRKGDLADLKAAGSPSLYAALGGFGPQGNGQATLPIQGPGEAYSLGAGGRILGIDGSKAIDGHGGISNPSTWWLACTLAYQA